MEVSCKISKNEKGGYHVFLNDVDVAPYITEFSLELNLNRRLPTVVIAVPVTSLDCEGLTELIAKNGHP